MATVAYILICAGLFLAAQALAVLGLHPMAMALFPVPAAYYWAVGRRPQSLGLAGCAALAGLAASGLWIMAAAYAYAAAIGIVLAAAVVRGWSFGRCVVAGMLLAYVPSAASMIANWAEVRKSATIFLNARIAELEAVAPNGNAAAESAFVDVWRWIDVHYAYLSLGINFGALLLIVTLGLAVIGRWLRLRGGAAQVRGLFREMRPPDALVWLAILMAFLWFVDRQWPNDTLRMVSWNTGVGLAFIYGLNGLSIFFYAMNVFRLNVLVCLGIVLLLFLFGAQPLLCALGLFDTWWEYRRKLDRIVEARQLAQSTDDRDRS